MQQTHNHYFESLTRLSLQSRGSLVYTLALKIASLGFVDASGEFETAPGQSDSHSPVFKLEATLWWEFLDKKELIAIDRDGSARSAVVFPLFFCSLSKPTATTRPNGSNI